MKNILLLLLLSVSATAQNLLDPALLILSEGDDREYFNINQAVLDDILSKDIIDLDVGQLNIEAEKEIMNYTVTTSSGDVFVQSVDVFRSENGHLSVYDNGEVFMYYNPDSVPRVLSLYENGLYALEIDTSDKEFECAALDHPEPTFESSEITTLASKTVKVYIEADKALHDAKGGARGAVNWISSLFEVNKIIYAKEGISTEISEIFVWNTADAYPTNSSHSALLEFRKRRANTKGDLKHLIALAPRGLGGIAWVNVLCTSHNFAYSNIQSTFRSYPNYSWTVMVFAHEMGHNLGSPHTQSCFWGNTTLDNCRAPEGDCQRGPAPTNGGTIMSYCHLTPHGINLNNGFGQRPGDLVRTRVSAAKCLTEGDGSCQSLNSNASDITINSFKVNWGHTTGSYFVRHKVRGSSRWIQNATNQNIYTIGGLTPSTRYDYQVRSSCQSTYQSGSSITTKSQPINCGNFTNKTFETGFNGFVQSTNDDQDWIRGSRSTHSSATGPSSAHQGTYYAYIESSRPGYPNKKATLTSECFATKPAQALSFAYHMYGRNMGTLNVKLNGQTIWTKSGDQGNRWYVATVDLPQTSNGIIEIEAITGDSYRSDFAIDDIKLITTTPEACGQNAAKSTIEWIESIKFGNKVVSTGNNNGLLTREIDVDLGQQTVIVTPGHIRESCDSLFLAVYSEENGEWVSKYSGREKVAQTSAIQLTAGKWRFILSYEEIKNACDPVLYGEIENYILK